MGKIVSTSTTSYCTCLVWRVKYFRLISTKLDGDNIRWISNRESIHDIGLHSMLSGVSPLGQIGVNYSWTSVIRPSVIRISLLSGHDLAVYCLLSILSISNYRLYSLAQDKNKVVKYCICFILLSNPLNMSDNFLQIE